ncbi:MAG: polyphosphate kinase 2 family protein [Nostocoides sp.]
MAKKSKKSQAPNFSDVLRVGAGFDLAGVDPASTPGFDKGKKSAEKAMPDHQSRLADVQERLYAQSREGGTQALLLVVQGMDTSGKGGIMRHVVGMLDPQGVHYTAFKAPSEEERKHDFLWRMTNALPKPGQVGVFDRSQYEDVLIVRVHNLVPEDVWSLRYDQINAWEKSVADSGTVIVKVMLHIGSDEQKARLGQRLERVDKQWKYNPGDIDERKLWPAYMAAYQAALTKCSTDDAPWFVVPANHKWYARYAVANLVLERLEGLDLAWPAVDYDVAAEKVRLAAT